MFFTIYTHGGHLEFPIMTVLIYNLYNHHHINANYAISLKLTQKFSRKCHLNLFMNGIFIETSDVESVY